MLECIAYVHLKSGKLDLKTFECMFVGYSSTQKGYQCYHLLIRQFCNLADVTFEEYPIFFSKQMRILEELKSLHRESI